MSVLEAGTAPDVQTAANEIIKLPPTTPILTAKGKNGLRLTIDEIDYPLYLVNNNFEVEWCNAEAATEILGQPKGLAEEITERNILRHFIDGKTLREAESFDEIVRFHLALAKNRMSKEELGKLRQHIGHDDMDQLDRIYDEAQSVDRMPLYHTDVNLDPRGTEGRWFNLYATLFREGIVFAYAPTGTNSESLVSLLSRREVVIRDLLKKRKPFLTPLAVLVADLQNSVKICNELPPEEYFELINHIWGAMDPLFRKYYATHGKHVGDGMVYYFFPQPDCNYLMNAVICAAEMKETIVEISREWRRRKNWTNDLMLNIAVDEGQEWFGTYQTATQLEFTVLGDTINRAGRMSDFAQNGSVLVTKNMLGHLTHDERERVRFGIRRLSDNGEEMFVPNLYSQVSSLCDVQDPRNQKFLDIATLTITEVVDVADEE